MTSPKKASPPPPAPAAATASPSRRKTARVDDSLDALADSEAQMYRAISGALLDGKLKPGTPLRERTLSEAFGATRTAVRKVLACLERDGKVELLQNRGAFVPQPSIEDIRTVYQARRAVEGGVLLLSVRLSAAQLRKLDAHVKSEEAAHRTGDREESIRLAGAFHVLLAQMIGNAELEAFLQRLLHRTQLFVALYESPAHTSCAPNEHRAIVDALARGAAQDAAAEMLRHLEQTEERVTSHITPADSTDIAGIINRYKK